MTRRTVSLVTLSTAFILVLWSAPDVPLLVFAGILMAVFLRGGGDWISARTGLQRSWGLALFLVALIVAGLFFLALAAPALGDQFGQLWEEVPGSLRRARGYLDQHAWLRRVLDQLDLQSIAPSGNGAISTVSTTFGALGNVVIILFIGLYGAISPGTYVNGAVALVAPSFRPTARSMVAEAGIALRGWLRAQFVSMAVVGTLTGLGLWVLGVPLAPILAVLAGILTFIPNIGPIIAAIPSVLLGLASGPTLALWIVGLYVAVQSIESYLITPRVQQEVVSLPPAFTISFQLLLGVLFGIIGLALATPLAALVLRLGRKFYVEAYLDCEPRVRNGPGGSSGQPLDPVAHLQPHNGA